MALADSIKVSTYEVLAVLFPGAILLEVARRSALSDDVNGLSSLAYAGLAYALGLGLQGICGRPLGALEQRWRKSHDGVRRLAERVAQRRVPELARHDLLSYCLSRADKHRAVYDKFVALRDMARGLAAAALIAGLAAAIHGHVWVAAAALLATAGFVERYASYTPLPEQAIYTEFLAVEPLSKGEVEAAELVGEKEE